MCYRRTKLEPRKDITKQLSLEVSSGRGWREKEEKMEIFIATIIGAICGAIGAAKTKEGKSFIFSVIGLLVTVVSFLIIIIFKTMIIPGLAAL